VTEHATSTPAAAVLIFMTNQLREGDSVLVNNIPSKVVDKAALVTRIRTDVGQSSTPNTAIASCALAAAKTTKDTQSQTGERTEH